MTDLEQLVRDTLSNRASTVDRGPAWRPADVSTPRRHPAWVAPLIAAAVIIAVAAAVVGLRHVADRDRAAHKTGAPTQQRPSPTPTSSPDPSPTVTSLPPTGHPARRAALTTFGLRPLPGFALHEVLSEPGYQRRAVRITADPDVPIGCNGCESASDYITVYAKGRFDAAANGVTSWPATTVGTHPAHLGQLAWIDGPTTRLPTIAWEYQSDSWAVVQGVTTLGGQTARLQQVAAAVKPSTPQPIPVPFRLTWVPDLAVTSVVDDRSENYAFTLNLGSIDGYGFNALVQRGQTATVPATLAVPHQDRRVDRLLRPQDCGGRCPSRQGAGRVRLVGRRGPPAPQ